MPATTPQDRKRAKAEAGPVTFDRDGETFTLPVRADITGGLLRRHRHRDDMDFAFSILEELCDKPTLAALDAMTLDDLNGVLSDWQEHVFPDGDPGKS